MNEHVKPPPARRAPTQAAEGLPRWRWTTAELERVAAAGFFDDTDEFELIGGEIVPMSPTGRRYDLVREVLERALRDLETSDAHVIGESQFNLADDTYAKPDIMVRPAAIMTVDLRPDTVLLVVEVADSSLEKDLTTKAELYAAHGVRDYWVVEAWSLVTHVHRAPDAAQKRYASIETVAPSDRMVLSLAPQFSVRLADPGL